MSMTEKQVARFRRGYDRPCTRHCRFLMWVMVFAVLLAAAGFAVWGMLGGCTQERRANCAVCRWIDGMWSCPAQIADPNN